MKKLTNSLMATFFMLALFVTNDSCKKPVTPDPPKNPTLSIRQTPSGTVDYNTNVTISWTTANVASIKINGIGADMNGSLLLSSLKKDTILNFSAIGTNGGSLNQSITVSVGPIPAPVFTSNPTANPGTAWYNGTVTLTWAATGATSYTITSTAGDNTTTTGTEYVTPPLIGDVTYTITAKGEGTTSTSVTLTIKVIAILKTNLIWNNTTNSNNIWLLNGYSRERYPLTGHPEILPLTYQKYIFYIGDTVHVFLDPTNLIKYSKTDYQLIDKDSTYILSVNKCHMLLLTNSIFQIEQIKPAENDTTVIFHYVMTFAKQ